jgi:hypothetical protein
MAPCVRATGFVCAGKLITWAQLDAAVVAELGKAKPGWAGVADILSIPRRFTSRTTDTWRRYAKHHNIKKGDLPIKLPVSRRKPRGQAPAPASPHKAAADDLFEDAVEEAEEDIFEDAVDGADVEEQAPQDCEDAAGHSREDVVEDGAAAADVAVETYSAGGGCAGDIATRVEQWEADGVGAVPGVDSAVPGASAGAVGELYTGDNEPVFTQEAHDFLTAVLAPSE